MLKLKEVLYRCSLKMKIKFEKVEVIIMTTFLRLFRRRRLISEIVIEHQFSYLQSDR